MHTSKFAQWFWFRPPLFTTDSATRLRCVALTMVLGLTLHCPRSLAQDAPHSSAENLVCASCHLDHDIFGNQIGSAAGNVNACLSCHQAGGPASSHALVSGQQSRLWAAATNQPAGTGNSHRWDAGPAGRVDSVSGASTAGIQAGGGYRGVYAASYAISITSGGKSGAARFNWTGTGPGAGRGTSVLTGTNVVLEAGLTVSFVDAGRGGPFAVGDHWRIVVRPDLQAPTNPDMQRMMVAGAINCATCHDPHFQTAAPFDPTAPAYGVNGGNGRHFMREANDQDQMCAECHASRFVTSTGAGSHVTGVSVPNMSDIHPPTSLPLDKSEGKMQCSTCHQVHNAADSDGMLLRKVSDRGLCTECHALANVTTAPAAHFNLSSGVLWPGGQYGSQFPKVSDTSVRGSCLNCHQAHGWPNAASPSTDYPSLLVDQEEMLCFTCHDADGPAAKNVQTDFTRAYRHPVSDTDPLRHTGRSVECRDCHNPHQAKSGSHKYTITATQYRNTVTNAPSLLGVEGVSVDYSGLGNFQAPAYQ
jgi:predicted CXXCH cytochrome family protein